MASQANQPEQVVEPSQSSSQDTRVDITSEVRTCYMVLSYRDSKLGAACYHVGSDKIELFHERYEFHDFSLTVSLLKKFEPTDVVVGSNCGPKMFEFLKQYSSNNLDLSGVEEESASSLLNISTESGETSEVAEQTEQSAAREEPEFINAPINPAFVSYSFDDFDATLQILCRFNLHTISVKLFQYDLCKNRILSINLPQVHSTDSRERFIYLTSCINFEEINTIKALGVMLYFVEKNCQVDQQPNNIPVMSLIKNFVYFNLDYYVNMDHSSFEALEIFQSEWHPSISKKGLYKKEGLSLYGLFNSCASKLGSFYLRKIFLQPTTNYNVLQERLDSVEFFAKSASQSMKTSLFECLKCIRDITPIINRLKSSSFVLNDFQIIVVLIRNIVTVQNIMSQVNLKNKIFEKILRIDFNTLLEIHEYLDQVIDFEKSIQNGNFMIKPNADEKLDQLKHTFNMLPELLKQAISEESLILFENYALSVTIVYLPHIGFLVQLPLRQVQNIGSMDRYGLDLIFCAHECAYYKNNKTKEFDVMIGDIKSEITDQTYHVLNCLKEFIMSRIQIMVPAIHLCAHLDAILAMGKTAVEYNYSRPNLTCYGTIRIVSGRHPLAELISNIFIPNDYLSDGDRSKMTVVFGPSNCGKTVYLKQVSLIVYMAHIGSFVPTSYSDITIVDQIFTRIHTPESISTQLSSFKHDLNQMIMAQKYAKRRSLVVIDIFGKGTLPTDGYALLDACLHKWASKDDKPHLLVSTQFNLMHSLAHIHDIQFCTFELSLTVNTYKLLVCDSVEDIPNRQDSYFISNNAQQLDDIEHIVNNQTETLIPKLKSKENDYLEIANYLLSELPIEEINAKIFPIMQKYSKNCNSN